MKKLTPSRSVVVGICGLFLATFGIWQIGSKVLAEQSGSSPESGATSRIKTAYDWLVAKGANYGATDASDWSNNWGSMWNRIMEAATWEPDGTASEADVASTKTFYAGNGDRTIKTGTATIISLANMFNGSNQDGTFPGGSQANGGVEDVGKDPRLLDGFTATWTVCDNDNNYCGTGLASADAKDNSTGLIWSLPCNGSGCSSFSNSSPATYTWDNSGGDNNSQTASQLCSSGSHGESGWSLPHQKQLMMAYIDGAYGNFESASVSRFYWSATTISNNTDGAWLINLSSGYTAQNDKMSAHYLSCVRAAN